MANAPKVYNFPMDKVESQLVGWLKKSRGSSTVADMIAGTGLPKEQVELAARQILDEYAGRLKVTESGELLYSFPDGMRSTRRGAGPAFRRFVRAFARTALRVLTLLFKIWIVAMLVGYFVAFVLILLAAVLASFAASMAGNRDGRGGGGGRDRGGGFGAMYLVVRLFDLMLRMWFWSNLLRDPRRKKADGRAFYKSVFGFVFGDGDPNAGWDDAERKYILSYIVSHKGAITVEEIMALTGREPAEANALMNRLLLEYEGEPGVTDEGTVVYSFPALMRTARQETISAVPLLNPAGKSLVPFSANKKRTNGWIIFFNAFNLAFGSYFLVISLTQGAAALAKTGPYLYSYIGNALQSVGIPAVSFLGTVLGVIPVAFSILFFLVPLLRSFSLRRLNRRIREESLRRRVLAEIVANPGRVDPAALSSHAPGIAPRDVAAATRRIVEKLAAALHAEPVPTERQGEFAYRFAEIERQAGDLEQFRRKIDLKRYELGETIFDTAK